MKFQRENNVTKGKVRKEF